LLIQAARCE